MYYDDGEDMSKIIWRAEMQALRQQPPLTLQVPPVECMLIISNLQLALRHPENNGPSGQFAEEFARSLQRRIAPTGSPLDELLERGWNPAFDVQANEPAARRRSRFVEARTKKPSHAATMLSEHPLEFNAFVQAAIAVGKLNIERSDSIRLMTNGACTAYHKLEDALLALGLVSEIAYNHEQNERKADAHAQGRDE